MKAYYSIKNIQFLAILLFILVLALGCSSTKYIEDYQSIVKKVTIDSVDKAFEEQAYNYVQKDIRPAGGIGLNVFIYNIFNTKNGKYKTSNIKPLGEPPPILDSALVDISRTQIEKFLKSKGYFKASVKSAIAIKDKKAQLTFTADPGPAFFVNKVNYEIPDETVKQLYLNKKNSFTHLRDGIQYDEDSLVYEREQIYQLMRQNGYYEFVRPFIRYEPDSNLNNSKVNVKLIVDNKLDGSKHEVFRINEATILIAPNAEGFKDSINFNRRSFNGVKFIDQSKRFRRNPIVRYNFLKPGEIYNIDDQNVTYDRLYQLNTFKNVNIDYVKAADSTNKIDPYITLIPQLRMSNRIEGEVPFNSGTVGITLSNTYTNTNFFKGAERFQFQIKGGLQSRIGNNERLFKDIYQRDFSVSASLAVPRLMVPFGIPLMGKNGMPHTTFSASYLYALQKDITVRKLFITSISYDWVETKSKLHSLTPLNFEYRFGNVLTNTLDTSVILNNALSIALLGRKNITLGIKYAYTLNENKLNEYRSFTYFRGSFESAGNMLYGFSRLAGIKADPKNEVFANVLGLPYNQFIRPEIDVRYYKALGNNTQLVARLNAGIGYAYGNSEEVPFEKLFYAGGSNGIRAWQARTLGPGNYDRAVLEPELRRLLFGLDQLGSMIIQSNLEYRFTITNNFFGAKLKGATFLDMGNIWNLNDDLPGGKFDFKNIHKQIAIGTGFGFRYDVQFFVFRFDLGLKLKDPQFASGDQWVINKFFSGGKAFKANYELTHSPDRYRFMQYNFGIGMPF